MTNAHGVRNWKGGGSNLVMSSRKKIDAARN